MILYCSVSGTDGCKRDENEPENHQQREDNREPEMTLLFKGVAADAEVFPEEKLHDHAQLPEKESDKDAGTVPEEEHDRLRQNG